jgi:phosphoribosyl 1,2-cyclic phosphodiesterase
LISIILGFIVAIILGIGYWKKSRFLKNKKIEITERFDGLDLPISRKVELKASALNKLTPYLKESKKIEGITFIANNTNIKVLGEELDKLFNTGAVKKIFINGDLVGKDELKDKKEHILFTGNGIKIIYQEGKVKEYIYY